MIRIAIAIVLIVFFIFGCSKFQKEQLQGLEYEIIDSETILIKGGFQYQKGIQYYSALTGKPLEFTFEIININQSGNFEIRGEEIPILFEGLDFQKGKAIFDVDFLCVGINMIFTKPGIMLNNGNFSYTSKYTGSTIKIKEEGVIVKGFDIKSKK